MFHIHYTNHRASHSGRNRRLPSKWTQFLALTLAVLGLAGWAASPGYTSSRSALSRSAASGQMTPQSANVWTSNGLEGSHINSLAIDPSNPKIIFAGTNDGLFRSNDDGDTWNKTGLAVSFVGSLAIDSNNTDILYAVSSLGDGNTVFKSVDGGASWHEANNGLKDDLNVLVVDPHDSNTLYVGAYYEGVFKTTDGGANWKQINNVPVGASSLVIDPANSNILYATEYDNDFGYSQLLLKSANGGVDWKYTNNNLVYGTLAIDPGDPNVLYVDNYVEAFGQAHPGIAKSINGGASWTTSDTGLSKYYVNALAIDSVNSATIYAGTDGGGVFKSTDGGASWGEFNGGLTDLNISVLVIDPSGINLHAGASAGVFGYRYQAGCVDALSLTDQSFEFGGGTESVNVIAGSECSWAGIGNAGWLNVTSDSNGSGNGVVSFNVTAHTTSTRSRITTLLVGGRSITITQAGPPLVITGAYVRGRTLYVFGEKFDLGAVILRNGEEQNTRNDDQHPQTNLIGKKAGKKIISGQSVRLEVRNTNGALSPEFTFTRQ